MSDLGGGMWSDGGGGGGAYTDPGASGGGGWSEGGGSVYTDPGASGGGAWSEGGGWSDGGSADGGEQTASVEEIAEWLGQMLPGWMAENAPGILASSVGAHQFNWDPSHPETCREAVIQAKANCDEDKDLATFALGAATALVAFVATIYGTKLAGAAVGLIGGTLSALARNYMTQHCAEEQIANGQICDGWEADEADGLT